MPHISDVGILPNSPPAIEKSTGSTLRFCIFCAREIACLFALKVQLQQTIAILLGHCTPIEVLWFVLFWFILLLFGFILNAFIVFNWVFNLMTLNRRIFQFGVSKRKYHFKMSLKSNLVTICRISRQNHSKYNKSYFRIPALKCC